MAFYNVIRIYNVASGFGHFFIVFPQNHSLVEQSLERLLRRYNTTVIQHLVPESCIQQMQNGMLGSTDIQIDRQPVLQQLRCSDCIIVFRVDISQIIPAGACPLRHRIRFAFPLDTIDFHIQPVLTMCQR